MRFEHRLSFELHCPINFSLERGGRPPLVDTGARRRDCQPWTFRRGVESRRGENGAGAAAGRADGDVL